MKKMNRIEINWKNVKNSNQGHFVLVGDNTEGYQALQNEQAVGIVNLPREDFLVANHFFNGTNTDLFYIKSEKVIYTAIEDVYITAKLEEE